MSKTERNNIYLLAKALRRFGLVDKFDLGELVSSLASPTVMQVERAIRHSNQILPAGVSARYLAQQIVADLTTKTPGDDARSLVSNLSKIPAGKASAYKYQRTIFQILKLLFNRLLGKIIIEKEIFSKIKRVDIKADNDRQSGFFVNLRTHYSLYCPYIFFECKNYTNDPVNNEFDQLLGRLNSSSSTQVGFVICRKIKNEELALKRCRQAFFRDDRKLMICLTDHDLEELASLISRDGNRGVNRYLKAKLEEVILD